MHALAARYRAVRDQTMALAAPLSDEDCCVQSMADASPVKWHLAHTTWFFETFVLEAHEAGFRPFHPAFRMLFNSYYNGIGAKHPRPERGMITRPGMGEVRAYRRNVDGRIALLLERTDLPAAAALIELGLQHEQQHQELIVTDLKHLLSRNPLQPAYREGGWQSGPAAPGMEWLSFEAGVVAVGHHGGGFAFDNEGPRHRQFVEAYALASRLVTNGEYAQFIADGGYRRPELWLSEGWDWVQTLGLAHPLYWHEDGEGAGSDGGQEGWKEFTLYGLQPLDPQRPATHLSYFEADAYARWAGARLPSEAEWEHAAASSGAGADAALDRFSLHPPAADAAQQRLAQLFGACWQWTLSSYAPYPGFATASGAIGEYNGKFMCNQYVLRGSSCVTPVGHARTSYRNFFPASARWQFSGIRLARSLR